MGTYSIVVDGKVLDLSFRGKKVLSGGVRIYQVYVGEENLGRVVSPLHPWSGWEAQSIKGLRTMYPEPDRLRKVEGFKNRRYAAEYLIKHHGLERSDEL